jgi:hypothetical protein
MEKIHYEIQPSLCCVNFQYNLNENTVNDTNFRNKVARMEGNYKLG